MIDLSNKIFRTTNDMESESILRIAVARDTIFHVD